MTPTDPIALAEARVSEAQPTERRFLPNQPEPELWTMVRDADLRLILAALREARADGERLERLIVRNFDPFNATPSDGAEMQRLHRKWHPENYHAARAAATTNTGDTPNA